MELQLAIKAELLVVQLGSPTRTSATVSAGGGGAHDFSGTHLAHDIPRVHMFAKS